ncbi:hypothetical protein EV714DRAFT_197455 [Schizophyllum commune]
MDPSWRGVIKSSTEVCFSPEKMQLQHLSHGQPLRDFARVPRVPKVTVHWTNVKGLESLTFAFPAPWALTHLEMMLHDYASHDNHPPLSAVLDAIMSCKDTLRVCTVRAAIASIEPAVLARPAVTFPALESLNLHDEGACLALLISAPKLQDLFIEGNPTCEGRKGQRYISEEQALFRLKTLLDRSGDCPRLRSLVLFSSDLDKGDLVALLRRLSSLTELQLIERWDAEATPSILDALTRKPEDLASMSLLPLLTSLTICDADEDGSDRYPIWDWYKSVVRSRLVRMRLNGRQLACLEECHTISEYSFDGIRGGEYDMTIERLDEDMSEGGLDVDNMDMSSVESADEAEA